MHGLHVSDKQDFINITMKILENVMISQHASAMLPYVRKTLTEQTDLWLLEVSSILKEQINKWEKSLPDGDSSLYSLGLRQAVDLINGENPFING